MAQRVKHLPAMWETWVRSLGQEDPLEKEMATRSGTLAWKIPWTKEPGRLQSMGSKGVGHNWVTDPSLGDLLDPGIEPRSPTLQADALPSEPPGKPLICSKHVLKAEQYDRDSLGTLVHCIYNSNKQVNKKLSSLRFYIKYKSNFFILIIWNYECYYVTNIHEKYLCYTPKRSKLTGWPPTVRVTPGACTVMRTGTKMRCPRPHTPKRASPVAQPWRLCLQCRRCGWIPGLGRSRRIPWKRAWQPIPVFLPGKFHGQESLVGHSPWPIKSQTRLSN